MTNKREHDQMPVKVTAFVDKGIADLVTVLNNIPDVSTFSSCSGRLGKPTERAHVYLYCGEPFVANWLKTAQFANKLAEVLASNGSYDTDVALEWIGDKDAPFISIELHPKDINRVATILCDHKTEFSCDTLCKELRSLIECQSHRS